jgi:uncharacterized protein YndB with AHSA1/START domain
MDVNTSAPVVAAGEAAIDAAPEVVWDVMTDVERWPTWNPDVRAAAIDGPLREGATMRWKAGPGTIVSRIRRLDPPNEIAWTGRTLGIRAVHVWTLTARGAGTAVHTEESWEGLPARLFRRRMQAALEGAIEVGLRHLKAEAERRAAAGEDGPA